MTSVVGLRALFQRPDDSIVRRHLSRLTSCCNLIAVTHDPDAYLIISIGSGAKDIALA